MQRMHHRTDAQAGHEAGIVAHGFLRYTLRVALCLLRADAAFQTAHHIEPPVRRAAGYLLILEAHGHPQLALVQVAWHEWELKIAWHDANDQIGLSVEQDFAVEHAPVGAKASMPKRVTDQADLLVLIVFLLREETAEQGLYSERGKDPATHARSVDPCGLACPRKGIIGWLVAPQAFKGPGIPHVIADIGSGHPGLTVSPEA